MTALERLIQRATRKGKEVKIHFMPDGDPYEAWKIEYYPHALERGHFYAYHATLEDAAAKILQEIEETRL